MIFSHTRLLLCSRGSQQPAKSTQRCSSTEQLLDPHRSWHLLQKTILPNSFFSPCISSTYGFCASDGCQGNSPGNRVLLYPHSCARLLSGLCSKLNIIPAYSTQTPLTSPSAETSPGDCCLCTAAGNQAEVPRQPEPQRAGRILPQVRAAPSPEACGPAKSLGANNTGVTDCYG